MIRLNIGSDEEFNELQIALERSLRHEMEFLDLSDEPGMRSVVSEHIESIKILKTLLNRLQDLESKRSFKKFSRKDDEE